MNGSIPQVPAQRCSMTPKHMAPDSNSPESESAHACKGHVRHTIPHINNGKMCPATTLHTYRLAPTFQ